GSAKLLRSGRVGSLLMINRRLSRTAAVLALSAGVALGAVACGTDEPVTGSSCKLAEQVGRQMSAPLLALDVNKGVENVEQQVAEATGGSVATGDGLPNAIDEFNITSAERFAGQVDEKKLRTGMEDSVKAMQDFNAGVEAKDKAKVAKAIADQAKV